jgi:hypothetical protein
MSRYTDPTRSGLPINDWPAVDFEDWRQARANRQSPFRKYGGGRRISQHTLNKDEKGVCRWLGFLKRIGRLDDETLPYQRPTAELLDMYFEHLQNCGNADRSIVGRFEELQSALTIMYPGMDFRWITKPNGISIRQRLKMTVGSPFVPGNAELLSWGLDLFGQALQTSDGRTRCTQVRDSLIIALLATLAPRQRALASLQVSAHLLRTDSEWSLDQSPLLTKTGKQLVLPIDQDVAPILERYLGVERVELLNGRGHDALWVSWYGTPLSVSGIVNMLWRRSRSRFGVSFSTHRFRTSLTTTAAMEGSETPFDAALILGHGVAVSMAHYNRATAFAASRRHAARLAKLRQESEAVVWRAFGGKDLFDL